MGNLAHPLITRIRKEKEGPLGSLLDVIGFLRCHKKLILMPSVLLLLLLGGLVVLTSGSAVAPFIYAIF